MLRVSAENLTGLVGEAEITSKSDLVTAVRDSGDCGGVPVTAPMVCARRRPRSLEGNAGLCGLGLGFKIWMGFGTVLGLVVGLDGSFGEGMDGESGGTGGLKLGGGGKGRGVVGGFVRAAGIDVFVLDRINGEAMRSEGDDVASDVRR